jgi:1-deoxy-D-xylulose-5-phosphate synthase
MILRYKKQGNIIVTAEEGVTVGGFGVAVRSFLDRQGPSEGGFKQIGLPLEVYPQGKAQQLAKLYGLDEESLVRQLKEFHDTWSRG